MRAIFISYRREDSEGHAGRLFEDLCDRFGKASVFMDVAGIEPGRDFRRAIEQQVASCGVLLAVIGKDWLTLTDAQGQRRLDDPFDFVRLETANALKRDIPVIPVLVHQSVMPRAEQLPDDLKDLAFRNSVELTHARWSSDVQLLIKALLPYVDATPGASPAAPVPEPAPAAAPVATGHRAGWALLPLTALVLGGGGYVAWTRLRPAPSAIPVAAPVVDKMAVAAAPVTLAPPPANTASAPAASSPEKMRRVDRPATTAARPPAVAPVLPASMSTPASRPAPVLAAAPAATPAPAPAASPSPTPLPEVVAARSDPGLELLGSPGALSMVTRSIAIKPDTNFVNVTGGEVIRFDVGNRSFVWNFNGQRSSFNLAQVAPPSVLERKVTAYVAPNPMYPRRN
jgi:hypothetical protein